jgi:antitoxin ParD1/3/4
MLLEGLDSGESIEVTDQWWEQKRAQIMRRFPQKNK